MMSMIKNTDIFFWKIAQNYILQDRQAIKIPINNLFKLQLLQLLLIFVFPYNNRKIVSKNYLFPFIFGRYVVIKIIVSKDFLKT